MIGGVAASLEVRPASHAAADEELVMECRRGSEAAWGALVEKYRNLVYSVPAKYRMPPEDAADVFQEVWTDLFAELPRLRNPGALRSWLITVAGHKCYHWKRLQNMRARGCDPDLESVDPQGTFLDWKHEVEREQMLRDALLELPPRCREMVQLLFFEQPARPYKEVAERLGLAEGSIGFIRGRCLDKLRAALEKMGF
ncbi:MAG TPA: sigma-70 family RNA polymerase sigma factor [Bryobacteraceae bacterium]|nr:sigma-70 family RNA polymerase sigma factor [Bryobacteraceae bacterium]